MIKKSFPAIFLMLFILYGCNTGKVEYAEVNFSKPDEYFFIMEDSVKTTIAEGTLKIVEIQDSVVSGTYNFSKVYKENFSGYSSMKGIFSGFFYVYSNKAFLDMNPKIADNNVYVSVSIFSKSIEGEWYHSSLVGTSSKGRFKAYKLKE
jgi:hypothetical protein